MLGRSIALYRDLSLVLQDRIAHLRASPAAGALCKEPAAVVQDHHRALQRVLDLEANLGKQRRAWLDGGAVELDLAAARAEVLARLAVWLADR